MHCLGIESTAHTFGAAVLKDKKILSNIIRAFHTEKGGMKPNEVAEHHVNACDSVIKEALDKAGVGIKDIGLIAFSQSPGIGHMLRIGCMAARSLSAIYGIPLIGVNHCIAHLEIGRMTTKAKDPVLLYASGANTQIIAYEGGKYRIFGETLDIGIGNLLDAFAREAGIGFPGGPKIESLALKAGKEAKETAFIELPYCVKGMDVVFGGILTNIKSKLKSGSYRLEDLSYSLQETVFAMLIEVGERAMAHTGKEELLLGGGVACNKRLQEMANIMCRERNAKCFIPEKQFLVDNAAMIAWLGVEMYNVGIRMKIEDAVKKPYERTDEVEVKWR